MRQYKEVNAESARRVAERWGKDDAQADRKKEVRAIIERSRHREQEVQTVQEDVASENERALEEEVNKIRLQMQEQDVQMISLRMTVNE